MRSSGPARVLAPLALVLVLLAVVLIVRGQDDGSSSAESPATATTATTSTTSSSRRRSRSKTYTVRANDTLSAIAERTGVSVARLQSLNPRVDAGALQTGQRLKLTG